jgi:hypothetical protein
MSAAFLRHKDRAQDAQATQSARRESFASKASGFTTRWVQRNIARSTRRTFVTILALILVISVMFSISNLMSSFDTEYAANEFSESTRQAFDATQEAIAGIAQPSAASISAGSADDADASSGSDRASGAVGSSDSDGASVAGDAMFGVSPAIVSGEPSDVVFIGNLEESASASSVVWWTYYSKRTLSVYDSLSSWEDAVAERVSSSSQTEMFVIDTDVLEWSDADMNALDAISDAGTPVVFCSLPSQDLLASRPDVCSLLGIESVAHEDVELTGLHLFDGLFIGSEKVWMASEDEPDMLDGIDALVTWYNLLGGTRVYLRGVVDTGTYPEAYAHSDVLPPLVWRYSNGRNCVFAVQGSYLRGLAGMGMLSSFSGQTGSCCIYPIVNAQTLAINAYPDVADRGSDAIQDAYSVSAIGLQRDIVWGSFQSLLATREKTATFFLASSLEVPSDDGDSSADGGSDGDASDTVEYFMRSIGGIGCETGVSLDAALDAASESSIDGAARMDAGCSAIQSGAAGYEVSALFSSDEAAGLEAIGACAQDSAGSVRTLVTTSGSDDVPSFSLVSVGSRVVSVQRALSDCRSFTALDDLNLRGLQTALGYSVAEFDMRWLVWPRSDDDLWQVGYRRMLANYRTYFGALDAFDATTATESDARLRTMLACDYEQSIQGNTIRLKLTGRAGEAYFMLRTCGQTVASVEGGTAKELQEGWYLISASQDDVTIELADGNSAKARG